MKKRNDNELIKGLISGGVEIVHREGFERAEQEIQEIEKHIEYQKTQLSCVDAEVIPKLENLIIYWIQKKLWLNFAIDMRKLVKEYPHFAARALKPFISIIEMGEKFRKGQSVKASKDRKTKGIDPETRKKEIQDLKAAFEKRKNTANAFYQKHGKKLGLSPSTIRKRVNS